MEKKCLRCSKNFRTFPSHIKRGGGKYCSYFCSAKSRIPYIRTDEHKELMRQITKGKEVPRWIIEKGANARRGVSPSVLCKKIASERWSGEGNPKWRGGTARNSYGKNWRSQRKIVINRDKVCQDCKEWKKGKHMMHVHHMDNNKKNNNLNNLLLLCQTCHYKRHWNG